MSKPTSDFIVRRQEVEKLTGLSRSTIYAMMDETSPSFDPTWPLPVRLGLRSVGWRHHEVMAWISARPTIRPVATIRQHTDAKFVVGGV